MNFNEYQCMASETAIYPDRGQLSYPILGLCGEVGEVSEKFKKLIRDKGYCRFEHIVDPCDKADIMKELGDIIWYISEIATMLDLELETIAALNLNKLKDRKNRNVLRGSGDNR